LKTRAARDFLLDAHGVTTLASPTSLAIEWLHHIQDAYPGSVLWMPELVLIEAKTGSPADANVNRFIKTLDNPRWPDRRWCAPTRSDFERAAWLRTQTQPFSRAGISATDALLVAIADRMARRRGVSILTSDISDLQLLAEHTGRSNIAVQSLTMIQ
jgi:hypothetical protein